MANKQVAFHEATAEEYLAALDWYLERSEEAASRFAAELEQAVALIPRLRSAGLRASMEHADSC